MKSRNIIILIFLTFLFACEKELDWTLDPKENELVIIESLITNQKMNHLVKISKTNPISDGGWNPVSDATVLITDGNQIIPFIEIPQGSGFYFSTIEFRAFFGKSYILYVLRDGKEYIAADSSVPGEPIPPIRILQADNDLYTLNFEDTISRNPSMTRHLMSWANTSYCQASDSTQLCFAKVVNYDLKTVDVNENFKPEKKKVFFPSQTIIVRQKYSLSEPYRQFLRAMLSETEWRGGFFDVQRGNIPTNFSNGALGFFAVSTVVTDTTIVE